MLHPELQHRHRQAPEVTHRRPTADAPVEPSRSPITLPIVANPHSHRPGDVVNTFTTRALWPCCSVTVRASLSARVKASVTQCPRRRCAPTPSRKRASPERTSRMSFGLVGAAPTGLGEDIGAAMRIDDGVVWVAGASIGSAAPARSASCAVVRGSLSPRRCRASGLLNAETVRCSRRWGGTI
jgi:hypothetical protein